MKCLRCNSEMKHYPCNSNFGIYGTCHKPNLLSNKAQTPHNPHSVYICEKCGYVEFSTKYCENSDI